MLKKLNLVKINYQKANQFASKVYEEAQKANQGANSSEYASNESSSDKKDDNVVDADYEEK